MVSAQSATERDRAGRTRWPVLSASLAAASGILAALAYIAVELADWRRGGLLAVAAAFACAFAAMLRMFAPVRCAAWLDERASMLLLLPAVVASAIVAVAAEPDVMEHQWWWLGLWLAAVALVPVVCGPRIDPRASARFVGNHRIEIAVVAALVALATAARFVRLDTLPEPYSGDEALFALSALSVTEGDATNPFRFGPQSAPTLYLYYLGAFDRVLVLSPEIARASSAVLGIAAVIVTYFFLRELFNRTVAVCGALFLAAYHFHLQFGRESMPNIIDPVLIPLVLLFTYRAIRDGRRLDYAMAGLALGLTIYAWVSARLIPLEVAALVGWWVIAKRSMPANWLQGVIVASAAVFIAAAPLALHTRTVIRTDSTRA